MPDFRYKAVDAKGRIATGSVAAQDPADAAEILKQKGLFLLDHGAPSAGAAAAPAPAAPDDAARATGRALRLPGFRRDRVSVKELALLTSQLAAMVRSALPIMEALDLLALQEANPALKAILNDVRSRVAEGEPLSKAFARHPRHFDDIYVGLLAAGEAGGRLDGMLERLAEHMDFKVRIREKLQSALVYPALVILTAFGVVTFLVLFVLPVFVDVFKQLNLELPLCTRIVLWLGTAARRWWYAPPLALASAVWGLRAFLKDPGRALWFGERQLRVPIFGRLLRDIALTRVLRTLASLFDAGVPMLLSLDLAKAAAGHPVFRVLVEDIKSEVKEGRGLAPSFAKSPHVPPVVVGMISTGERTGTLPEALNRVAAFYERETDGSIKNMLAALEPAFVVGLGFMVGGLAVSVLLPMFNMAEGIN